MITIIRTKQVKQVKMHINTRLQYANIGWPFSYS